VSDLVLWLVRTDARMWLCVVVALSLMVVAGCVAWPFKTVKEESDDALTNAKNRRTGSHPRG
jgi:hypothetical protein